MIDGDEMTGTCQQCYGDCPATEKFCCDLCEESFNQELAGLYEDDQ